MADQDNDYSGIGTLSTVLETAGAFAFIFPGAGQVIGGALAAMGGLFGLAATQPADHGPSLKAIDDDINALEAVIKAVSNDVETYDIRKHLSKGSAEYDNFNGLYYAALKDPSAALIQKQQNVPDLVSRVENYKPLNSAFIDAIAGMEVLTHHKDKISALVVHAHANNQINLLVRKHLEVLREAYYKNYHHRVNSSHPNRPRFPETWEDWNSPPADHQALVVALKQNLHRAISYAEPVVNTLHNSFRTRRTRAETYAAGDPNSAALLKNKWEEITKDEFLDKITETDVDMLRGTDRMMGVVDIWKDSLINLFNDPHPGPPFKRGDKADPAKPLPICWFNGADTPLLRQCAKGVSGTHALSVVNTKLHTKLAANDRPLVRPIRYLREKKKRQLTLVVVNATAEPLLIDEFYLPYGALLTRPCVPIYPNLLTGNIEGYTMQHNRDSLYPDSWVDAAPVNTMGKGTSSAGIWQITGVPSLDRASIVIKFKAMPKTGYKQCYIGAEMPASPSTAPCTSIGIADHGSAAQFFDIYVDGKGRTTDKSSACYSHISPVTIEGQTQDLVSTFLIQEHDV